MITTLDPIKASKRKPLRRKIEKEITKEDIAKKKKEDSAYLSSYYFKDFLSR